MWHDFAMVMGGIAIGIMFCNICNAITKELNKIDKK